MITLVWITQGKEPPHWPLGDVYLAAPLAADLAEVIRRESAVSSAEAWLFWDSRLGTPNSEKIAEMLQMSGDIWHGGLRLGMEGRPGMLDFVHPTRMFTRDPDPSIVATSWRLSLRACLIRTNILQQLGGPDAGFETLDSAALDMGHRYVMCGAIARHVPGFVPRSRNNSLLSLNDEVRFIHKRFGRLWTFWAALRALATGYAAPAHLIRAWQRAASPLQPADRKPLRREAASGGAEVADRKVSVVIPTLDRYTYLEAVLNQLRTQTVAPIDVIVIDQTPASRTETDWIQTFRDLPLEVIRQDVPGQCSARNAGIRRSRGDFILFIDDDDEIEDTLIEQHLQNLVRFRADVSCGVADEAGAGPLPEEFRRLRVSDVFPTNNTLLKKNVLERSGLFDLAYDRGQNEDHDLGMRLYLAGALMVLDPDISVFHHRAPRGGLRSHGARVITYASSRARLLHRNLPSVSEIYLAKRYFTERQVDEMLRLRVAGTFSARGSAFRKIVKACISLMALPHTLAHIRKHQRRAEHMLRDRATIPALHEGKPRFDNGLERESYPDSADAGSIPAD